MDKIRNILSKYSEKIILIFFQLSSTILILIFGKIVSIYIKPEKFGEYNLQYAILILAQSIFINPILQFIKKENQSLNKKIGFRPYVSFILVGISLSLLLFHIGLSLKFTKITITLSIIITIYLIAESLYKIITENILTEGKYKKYGLILFLTSTITLFIFVLSITLGKESDYYDLWFSTTCAYLLLSLIIINKKFTIKKKRISYWRLSKKIIIYAYPLILMAIFSWSISFADKVIIDSYLGREKVGIYSASFAIGSKFFLMVSPIFITLMTPKIYSNDETGIKKNLINKTALLQAIIGLIVIIIMWVMYDFIGNILLSKAYNQGFVLIPLVGLAYLILTISYNYELYFYAESKTHIILLTNVIGAICVIILHNITIPLLGMNGAAITLIIGFTLKLIITLIMFKKS